MNKKGYFRTLEAIIAIVVIFVIGIFLLTGLSSGTVIDQLDQFQTQCDDWCGLHDGTYDAQSFKPTLNTLTRVELLVEKTGDPSGFLQISIKNSLNGDDLTFTVIQSKDISTISNWYEFDFPDIHIPPEYTLYIVWAPAANLWDDDNMILWCCNWQDNPYIRGKMWNERLDQSDLKYIYRTKPASWINFLMENGFIREKREEKTYHVGQRFENKDAKYILAHDGYKVFLINLERWQKMLDMDLVDML